MYSCSFLRYDYFKRHNIPHVPVIGQWDSKGDFWSWIRSDKAEFPLIVKFCHLTQGTQAWKGFKEVHGNTFFLKNKGHFFFRVLTIQKRILGFENL